MADLEADHILRVGAGDGESVEVRVIAEVELVHSVASELQIAPGAAGLRNHQVCEVFRDGRAGYICMS